MKFKPVGDRVVVRPFKAEEEITGSGIITGVMKEAPSRGTVLKKGRATEEVEEGYEVIYGKHAGTKIELDGEEFLVMRCSDAYSDILLYSEPDVD